jgi:hypothetical protein
VEIRVGGVLLREVKVFKYLGFLITPDLSLAAHITRAATRAKAASSTIGRFVRTLNIRSLSRLGTYLSCYVESQFFCMELLPPTAVAEINSARSHFVRTVFDLPLTTSHELATILFDAWPTEILLLNRRRSFLAGLVQHDFGFIRDALHVDMRLLNLPKSWCSGLVRLIRSYDPTFSTTDFDPTTALDTVLSSIGRRSVFNFYYIKFGDSESLSFFRIFDNPDDLNSFRDLLESLPSDQCRLVILFTSSLLRFRFCASPTAICPLCRKTWLWEHFFTCPKLVLLPSLPSAITVAEFKSCVRGCDWTLFRHFLRFILTQWHNVIANPAISLEIIEGL